jgi:hypothetical protein
LIGLVVCRGNLHRPFECLTGRIAH